MKPSDLKKKQMFDLIMSIENCIADPDDFMFNRTQTVSMDPITWLKLSYLALENNTCVTEEIRKLVKGVDL